MRKRRRLVSIAIALGLTVLVAAVAVPLRADAAWQAMNAEVATLRAEVRAAPTRRHVLWGKPTEGSAHAHYERAIAAARALQKDHLDELLATLRDDGAEIALRRRDLRQAWQPVLAALRAGAAAVDVSAPLPGDENVEPKIQNLLDYRWIANAAVFEARALRHEGRHVEAVQQTLDAAALAADLVRRGALIDQMIGAATLAIATTEAWPEPALSTLDQPALDALESGLQHLDESLPTVLDDRRERLFMAWHIQNASGSEDWLPSTPSAWRFGFSTRWMLADAFLRHSELAHRLTRAGSVWAERAATWDRESAAALASGNPVIAVSLPNLRAAEGSWREVVAKVRLLRMAVDLHCGRPPAALLDPIGGAPIRVTRSEHGTTLECEPIPGRAELLRFVRH